MQHTFCLGGNFSARLGDQSQRLSRRPFFATLFPILGLALGLGLAAPSPCAAAVTFLRTRGQDIINENGDKIILRGVGLGNWMLPEGYMWKFGNLGDRPRKIEKIVSDLIGPGDAKKFWTEFRQNYITEADIQRIAELGYNSMRPALNARLFQALDGAPDESSEGFQLLDHLVAWGKTHGVYVIIDLHAAPGGQTGQNIDDSAHDKPELFMDPKYQDQTLALWTAIARRYHDEPAVAGYDLLNEPLPDRTGAARTYKAQLEPLYKRLTAAIREVDPKHMVIVEGADWANDWSVFTQPFDSNMVYQFHYYCWDNPAVVKSARRYIEAGKRFNAPVWVGETGERDSAIYWATTEYFEANNMGWSFWPWKKMDTRNTPFSIKPPADWEAIAAYSRNGAKPTPAVARKAFDELLANIRLENCAFVPAVVHAMLREAPVRLEAENFSVDGPTNAYFLKDTSHLSHFYRTSEPVPIISQELGRRQSEQHIALNATEWTAYHIHSATLRAYPLTLRARATQLPCEVQVIVGDEVRSATLSTNAWTNVNLGSISLAQGANRLKLAVVRGAADLDWLDLGAGGKPQQSAAAAALKVKQTE